MIDRDRDGGFLGRWSRRKIEARGMKGAETVSEEDPAELAAEAPAEGPEETPGCDLSSLPPVDSLSADSDYRAFMRDGVPAALRRAALRKAWTTDPAIRNYKTLADYDWDFNAEGYGALREGDAPMEIAKRLLRGRAAAPTDGEAEGSPPAEAEPDYRRPSNGEAAQGEDSRESGSREETNRS